MSARVDGRQPPELRPVSIETGFQEFADKYPESSLADEALYSAGVHFLIGARDREKILDNMRRIVREHPQGNILREYRNQNAWLRRAINDSESLQQ